MSVGLVLNEVGGGVGYPTDPDAVVNRLCSSTGADDLVEMTKQVEDARLAMESAGLASVSTAAQVKRCYPRERTLDERG